MAVSSIEQLTETKMTEIAALNGKFDTKKGTQRMTIINIGDEQKPSYLKIVESNIVAQSPYVTEFFITIPTSATQTPKLGNVMVSNYVGDGLYQNFQNIPNFNIRAKLLASKQPFQNNFGSKPPTTFLQIIRVANILGTDWLVLAFDESAAASAPVLANYDFSTPNGINNIGSFAISLEKSTATYSDAFTALTTAVAGYKVMEKNLLISAGTAPVSNTQNRLDILQVLRTNILCTNLCYYVDTPINKAFRINDEEAFGDLKTEPKDTWEKRDFGVFLIF